MTIMLLTLIIVCISNGVFSQTYNESIVTQDDLVDNIFDIEPYDPENVSKLSSKCLPNWYFHEQDIQNIGKTSVNITARRYSCIVNPLETKRLPKLFTLSLKINVLDELNRAIVYSSVYRKRRTPNIENIQKDLDRINVVKETFTVGVKNIPKDHLNLKTLISYFWPEKEANIWQQLFEVFTDLIYSNWALINTFVNEDIENIKKDMVALMENNVTDITNGYFKLDKNLKIFDSLMDINRNLNNFYVFPLYTNIVKLHLYLSAIGIANPKIYQPSSTLDLREVANRRFCKACERIMNIQTYVINQIYNDIYAPGLFNVLMNAYSYIAFHGLQLFSVWEEKYFGKLKCSYCTVECTEPIAYSNLYGKATPDLLKQAIHIDTSPLSAYCEQNRGKAAKLNSILFYIRTENELKTVYGLSLMFSSKFSTTMGASQTSEIIEKQELSFANSTIIKLKVYRTVFIKCLEFTWVNGTSTTVGDNCGDVFGVFQLKDHYINSLYLANDYPDTGKYFDNIAVSYVPNSL